MLFHVRPRFEFLAKMPQSYVVSFSMFHMKGFMMSVCSVTGDANLHHLVKVLSVMFLHYKAAITPFVVNKYLGRPWFLRRKWCKIALMFSNDWAPLQCRKTSSMTLNTDKFIGKEEILSLQENFLQVSFSSHLLLPFALTYLFGKKTLTYSTLIWGNSNYLIYFGYTAIHYRWGIR